MQGGVTRDTKQVCETWPISNPTKEFDMPMLAKDVAPMIYQMLVDAVEEVYEGESESAKQEALFDILTAMTAQMCK